MIVVEMEGFSEYGEEVLAFCEYYDVPSLVQFFEEEDVAKSISRSLVSGFIHRISPRMNAIIIWSMAMKQLREIKCNSNLIN